RLMKTTGRDDLGAGAALASNTGRDARVDEIDAAISPWTATRAVNQVLTALSKAGVPSGRIYTVADIAADPHYQARSMIGSLQMDDASALSEPAICPKLSVTSVMSVTPDRHRRNAPRPGQDIDAILLELGLSAVQIQGLKDRGIVTSANPFPAAEASG
ncbi:MAG: CoA transferase, partial [Polaromonas sp.]|nr:CoA transferase [Polaromonas sp.]